MIPIDNNLINATVALLADILELRRWLTSTTLKSSMVEAAGFVDGPWLPIMKDGFG